MIDGQYSVASEIICLYIVCVHGIIVILATVGRTADFRSADLKLV